MVAEPFGEGIQDDLERRVAVTVREDGRWTETRTGIPEEEAITLRLNGKELVTLLSSPGGRRELGVGFLYAEGVLDSLDQLEGVRLVADGIEVEASGVDLGLRLFDRRVLGSGCGKASSFVGALDTLASRSRALPQELPWIPAEVVSGAAQVTYGGAGGRASTRGTHSAALFDRSGDLVVIAEDIGRHNAVDKVIGHCLLHGHALGELFLVVTGRISSELAAKAARTPLPLVVSKSVPTALAVEYATSLRLCLVGRVRRSSLTVFSCPELLYGPLREGAEVEGEGA